MDSVICSMVSADSSNISHMILMPVKVSVLIGAYCRNHKNDAAVDVKPCS